MKLSSESSTIYFPDQADAQAALARTTHMGIGAHADDLEIMAIDGILTCYARKDAWFAGVTVSDGAGAPRAGRFADYTDEQMVLTRIDEQMRAADLGEYGAQILLGYSTAALKDPSDGRPVEDIAAVLQEARPDLVYTHNLMDKHDAHVAVALRVIDAIRRMPEEARPKTLYGCEVWRDLDWLPDKSKIIFDCSGRQDLQRRLLEVFESQVDGGKRYDLAAMGRRRANATYLEPHAVDETTGAVFGVDMTPLIRDDAIDPATFARAFTDKLAADVRARIEKLR